MSLFAEPILKLLFPNANEGSTMLRINAWSIIFILMLQTTNGTLQGLGKVNVPVIALTFGIIIKFVLNILLINNANICVNGAIISGLVSHIIVFIICFVYLIKYTNIKFNFNQLFVKPILATGIMIVVSNYIYRKLNINVIISILIGSIIYVVLIILLKILTKEEVFMLPYGQKAYNTTKKNKA